MTERIAQETIEQVKQYSGIVDYIQQFVSLKKRGQNYLGLCPFHSEKTPSFTVSAQKEIFHCFGCHESGDLIAFAEKIEQLTFVEAVERIAVFAGINVVKEQQSPQDKRKAQLMEHQLQCLQRAQEFFVSSLKASDVAQSYLKVRQVNIDFSNRFELGYCESSQRLLEYMKKHGFSDDILLSSGLFSRNERGLFCRFHQRLVFSIFDAQHRLLGFSGRVLSSDVQGAKYINSDESAIFNKRRLLYGVHLAKKAIKDEGFVILVEGYMDVIICAQFGLNNVVACMGTSLTQQQAVLLKRFSNRVVLVFDNDPAGHMATKRSITVLMDEDMLVDSVRLNDLDPAAFLLEKGLEAFKSCLAASVSAFEFLYEESKSNYDLSKVEEASKCVQDLLPVLHAIKDQMVQRHYVKKLSFELTIAEELIMAKLNQFVYNETPIQSLTIDRQKVGKNKYQKAEETILAIVCTSLKLREELKGVSLTLFNNEFCKNACSCVLKSDQVGADLFRVVPQDLQGKLSHLLLTIPSHETEALQEQMFQDCLNVLKTLKFNNDINQIKQKIVSLEGSDNELEMERLMEELGRKKKGGIYEY